MNSKTDADNKSISKEIFFPNDEIGVSGKIGDGVFKKEDKIMSIWNKVKELSLKIKEYFKRIGEWIVKQYSKFLPK